MSVQSKNIKTIADIDVKDRVVLFRADLNVPTQNGQVSDPTRLERVVPSLQDLAQRGAKLVVMSHFARPKGKRVADMSLKPVGDVLAQMLPGHNFTFVSDCIGEDVASAVRALNAGDILLLENLRFSEGEEKNDPQFAQNLASLAEIYVNDAFSTAHRAHASTEGVTKFLPSYAGQLMEAEINALTLALENPKRPVAALVGGAKISTKLPVLTNLMQKVDKLIIGGGMANTFLYAQGIAVGKSLCEEDFAAQAKDIMDAAKAAQCDIILPQDVIVAKEFAANAPSKAVDIHNVAADDMILDVGPQSQAMLQELLASCATLVWNGPLGAFEIAPFGDATFGLAREAARLTQSGALVTVAGGGDTVAALNMAGPDVAENFTYISTAGGAFLEWLEGRELPGVAAIMA